MAHWLIENVVWLAAVVVLLFGVKLVVARVFKRLADNSQS